MSEVKEIHGYGIWDGFHHLLTIVWNMGAVGLVLGVVETAAAAAAAQQNRIRRKK